MRKFQLIILVITVSIIACTEKGSYVSGYDVGYEGALKNFMKKGDISSKADLSAYQNTENLYALGAMENLKGEIQIFDSQAFNTYILNNELKVDDSYEHKASLLVHAIVNEWKALPVPDEVQRYDELEKYIYQAAKENNINHKKPFPFLLEGIPSYIDWHVINWKEGDTDHTHEKHITSGLNGKLENTLVDMLGFYSRNHKGIFTHHTTNMHIHVKSKDNKLGGHVDDIKLARGMTLKLPQK